MADAEDLKSSGRERPCGFDSHRRHLRQNPTQRAQKRLVACFPGFAPSSPSGQPIRSSPQNPTHPARFRPLRAARALARCRGGVLRPPGHRRNNVPGLDNQPATTQQPRTRLAPKPRETTLGIVPGRWLTRARAALLHPGANPPHRLRRQPLFQPAKYRSQQIGIGNPTPPLPAVWHPRSDTSP
jgi:hypothetical protein